MRYLVLPEKEYNYLILLLKIVFLKARFCNFLSSYAQKVAISGSTPDHEGPTNVDRRLGDAHKIALKAISCAWSRPEKPMEGFFRANYLDTIDYGHAGTLSAILMKLEIIVSPSSLRNDSG
jgi:hypothetical protein